MSILNKKIISFLSGFIFLYTGFLFASEEVVIPSTENKTLKGGWYTVDPYLYLKDDNGVKSLAGLDYEMMKAISLEAKIEISYSHAFWKALLNEVETGKKDFATGTLYSTERAQYVHYSIPYRHQEYSLFILKNNMKLFHGKTIEDVLKNMKEKKLKLGVVEGFLYGSDVINQYISNPDNKELVIKTAGDYPSVEQLFTKEIDAFLVDRIVGSTMIWRLGKNDQVSEYRLNVKSPIHLIFSKKTADLATVDKYNNAITKIKNTEQYQKLMVWYLYPILFLQTEDSDWFRITEIIGIVAFAISGLIIAFKERATLFGALVLAILPSLGGGLIRDVIFGRNPVGALRSPVYLSTVLLTVVGGFMMVKLLKHMRKHYKISREIEALFKKQAQVILVITDAIGLAMFTVTGVIVSLLAKVDPLWLWGPFFAFITGAGGGILRDMLSKTRYIAALEGELYGEIAIFWGFILSVFILFMERDYELEHIQYAVIITTFGVFLTRLIIHFMHVPNARFGHHHKGIDSTDK